MNMDVWIDNYLINKLVLDVNEIKSGLRRLQDKYLVYNESSSSKVTIGQAVHVRRADDKKIYAHLIIEDGKLLLGISRAPYIERDSASDILPKLLPGVRVKSEISNIRECVVLTKENIEIFVNLMWQIYYLNK